jgi:hypothetical protein
MSFQELFESRSGNVFDVVIFHNSIDNPLIEHYTIKIKENINLGKVRRIEDLKDIPYYQHDLLLETPIYLNGKKVVIIELYLQCLPDRLPKYSGRTRISIDGFFSSLLDICKYTPDLDQKLDQMTTRCNDLRDKLQKEKEQYDKSYLERLVVVENLEKELKETKQIIAKEAEFYVVKTNEISKQFSLSFEKELLETFI